MTLLINDQPHAFDTLPNLQALLEQLDYQPNQFAVAVNETFVPRGQYHETTLKDGDRIEIVAPMQGG
jgi:sulfur carrier protein